MRTLEELESVNFADMTEDEMKLVAGQEGDEATNLWAALARLGLTLGATG